MNPIDYSLLPEHLRDGMRRYVEDGIEPGSFLFACLSNDLAQAVIKCAKGSAVEPVVRWLWEFAPQRCWGTRDHVKDWILMGGLRGLEKERKS